MTRAVHGRKDVSELPFTQGHKIKMQWAEEYAEEVGGWVGVGWGAGWGGGGGGRG